VSFLPDLRARGYRQDETERSGGHSRSMARLNKPKHGHPPLKDLDDDELQLFAHNAIKDLEASFAGDDEAAQRLDRWALAVIREHNKRENLKSKQIMANCRAGRLSPEEAFRLFFCKNKTLTAY